MSDGAPTDTPQESAPHDSHNDEYRVLARKYRPTDFNTLIGQDALVRTLTNAIESGRLAHAFMLTGVRGVGKTTTARIIARALNCVGPDGQGGETAEPCGVCENCRAIAEDRHVDVIEMDAASRTGVDDIREIIEGVRYKPVNARYKVYIIDEVHMLSKNAFNALLKTLEEPPEHVKFIFATTEIRKVPVTVLSRCQRFDLRRIDMDTLAGHFKGIVAQENASVTDGALAMIARAADGSVRDGLSLLDQAIAHTAGAVDETQVRAMLGLADRARTFDLLDAVFKGAVESALDQLADQYDSGADPVQVLEDLLELVHWLTRIKVTPAAADAPGVAEMERTRGQEMAGGLTMAALTRAWQMLLKGLGEVRGAPSALQAAEMILVRLMYGLELPGPADVLKKLENAPQQPAQNPGGGAPQAGGPQGGGASVDAQGSINAPGSNATHAPTMHGASGYDSSGHDSSGHVSSGHDSSRLAATGTGDAYAASQPDSQPLSVSELELPDPCTLEEVVELTEERGEMILHANLISNVHLVSFQPGKIEYHPGDHAPQDLAQRLTKFLNDHTPRRWVVSVSRAAGQATIRQQQEAHAAEERAEAARDPLVQAVLDTFPGAELVHVKDVSAQVPPLPQAPEDGAPGVDDDYPGDDFAAED